MLNKFLALRCLWTWRTEACLMTALMMCLASQPRETLHDYSLTRNACNTVVSIGTVSVMSEQANTGFAGMIYLLGILSLFKDS